MKTSDKILKSIELRAQGKSMEAIGAELGVTRQTVSAYLRSPEAQAVANELQTALMETLQSSLKLVDKTIKAGLTSTNPKERAQASTLAKDIAINLGKVFLAQTPQGTQESSKLEPSDRQALLERLKRKISPIIDTVQLPEDTNNNTLGGGGK